MGQIGVARQVVGQRSKLFRLAIAVAVLAPGLWLGTAAVSPPAAMATSLCGVSSNVTGKVHNDTGVSLYLGNASHGVSNTWCTFPPSSIAPHSFNDFSAGDNIFETVVDASYTTPNDDVISLSAASRFFSRAEASCSVSGPANTAPAYRCHATVSHNSSEGGNNTVADFFITP